MYRVLKNSIPNKVPGLAATRWLARLEAINVIIDQWDALLLHFEISVSNERCHTAKQLSQAYRDPQNILYLLFVRNTLKEIVKVELFQGQGVEVTKITEDIVDRHRSLMQIVVDSSYLSKCSKEICLI